MFPFDKESTHGGEPWAALQAKARKAGVRAKTLFLYGVADKRIIQAAHPKKADLIVIGTQARTGLARLFLGSVTSRLMAGARWPVLTARGH